MNSTVHNTHTTESLSSSVVQRFRLVVVSACSLAMSLSLLGWLMVSLHLAVEFNWQGIALCISISIASFAHYSYARNFQVLRRIQLLYLLLVPLVAQLSLESGNVSGIILWSFLAPVSVSMIAAREERHALYWLGSYVLVVLASFLLAPLLGHGSQYATDIIVSNMLPGNIALFTCVLTFALYYSLRHRTEINQLRKQQYFNLQDQHTQLNSETARKDILLGSVLPARIAKRMLAGSEMIADGHSDVTVMFADIVGFTKLADSMSPKQIVRLLNQLFSGYDEIAERHGLEKIKTIGDAFLAVGGLENSDHTDYVAATLRAAQDFQNFLREQTQGQFNNSGLDIHIGIATGPIAAGVIGKIRQTYDIWGNTVNLASRLADKATAGQILVDTATYKRVAKQFEFSEEEQMTLKGGIEMNVYRLNNSGIRRTPDEGNIYKLHA